MNKNTFIAVLCFISLALSALACGGSNNTEYSSPNTSCSSPLSPEDSKVALSRISFDVPSGWREISPNQKYSTGASLLNVFVFKTSASPKNCVETLINVVSRQSVIENQKINSTDFYIDNLPAVMAVADGYSDSTKNTPVRGIYASFANGEFVYLFAWDSFGLSDVGTIADSATYTINSIDIR